MVKIIVDYTKDLRLSGFFYGSSGPGCEAERSLARYKVQV